MSVTMAAPRFVRMPRSQVALAWMLLVLVIATLWLLPLRIALGATRHLNRCAREVATSDDALAAVRAARRAAAWWPGRAACLEISLTATWLAALRARAVGWCHGVQVHPYTFHAWVEADGVPVGEPATTSTFLRTMTIPAQARTARTRRSHP
jgi:hypothetical protein